MKFISIRDGREKRDPRRNGSKPTDENERVRARVGRRADLGPKVFLYAGLSEFCCRPHEHNALPLTVTRSPHFEPTGERELRAR